MPIYVYQVVLPDGSLGQQFEFFQSMSEPALTQHPETGQPVHRVILPPNIGGAYSESSISKTVNDDRKLESLGFTKYVKSGDGTYEKTAGSGPRTIQRN